MKPMLKYRGGKSKEISKFIQYIPKQFDCYYEPFFGGGALYFYLEPQNAIVNDINERLMEFYEEIKDKYKLVRDQLDELQKIYDANQTEYSKLKINHPNDKIPNKNEKLYYELRDMFKWAGYFPPSFLLY